MIGILILGIVVLLTCCTIAWWVSTYNFLKTGIESIKDQWSNLITEYERRVDLILNLVKTVKSFKKHEKNTLVELTKARSGLRGKNPIKNAQKIDSILSGLHINVEAYPELKAGEQHTKLMEEITECEDRINAAKTGYNTVVREFNNVIVSFPSNIVAQKHNIAKSTYYETKRKEVGAKAPEVEL